MSVAAAVSPRRKLRPLLLITLVAAAAGAGLGFALAPDGPDAVPPRAPAPVPRIGLASGVARLPLPAGWQPLRRRSSLPGLEEATAVRGSHSDIALDIRAPETASLLPARVEDAVVGDLPAPRLRRLDARAAWRYELPGTQPSSRVVAYALPTTGGVVTIACGAGSGAIARAEEECETAIRALQLKGAASLLPAPETAALIVLPQTVARLNRQRRSWRRTLRTRNSPQGRSAAALRLARGYAAAAERLRPLAAGDILPVTAALVALAHEHRALAAASRQREPSAARRAGARIVRKERLLARLLAALNESHAGS